MTAMTIPQVALPAVLPVFPLTGVLLLPGTLLPLHIFEPRYRNMVDDALRGEKVFGMIQPVAPQQDNRPRPGTDKDTPELYKVGCAGYIESWERFPDGRLFIQLKGVNRFRFADELPQLRGYRRVNAIYSDFLDDAAGEWICERKAILEALATFGQARGMEVKPDQAVRFSNMELVNLLAVSLPFHPAEKQALLEASTLKHRERILIKLLRLGGSPTDPDDESSRRTLN
jgi:Lon protease-like protein